MRRTLAFLSFLLAQHAAGAGEDVIATRPPEWTVCEWIGAKPMTLASLRGKVVVVRWWTGPDCRYCAGSVPVLDALWRRYRDRGLVVIGLYHHKARSPLTREHVVAQRERLGIAFPVAIDADWTTLRRWWLDGRDRAWTSVTFLLDREGRVRHVHPGGEIAAETLDAAALERAIEACL
jgi:peroxiredoxin